MVAWAQAGVHLEHFTDSQQAQTTPVTLGDLQAGDLVFYHTSGETYPWYHHVALYVGDGQMIEAPRFGVPVRLTPLREGDSYGRP